MTDTRRCMELKVWSLLHVLVPTHAFRHQYAGQCPQFVECWHVHPVHISSVISIVRICPCHHIPATSEDTDPVYKGPNDGHCRAPRQQGNDSIVSYTHQFCFNSQIQRCCCLLIMPVLTLTLHPSPKSASCFLQWSLHTPSPYSLRPFSYGGLLFRDPVLQLTHDWKSTVRIGEAINPGPPATNSTCMPFSLGLINPTTIYQKEDVLLSLNNDVLCLAETAATRNVQVAVNQTIRPTPYRAFWSAPVPDKIARSDISFGQSFRGDNLGTAILTRRPARTTRQAFPPAVWDTCRMNSIVVSTGAIDILVIAVYFHTGKSAEARIVNNQLLHDILLHLLPTDLPFIIAGDFNTDIRKLDAYASFRHMGCHEMFEFHRNSFGFDLPPTCKGATRYD